MASAVEALNLLELDTIEGKMLYPAFQVSDGYAEESRRPIDMLKDGELDQILLEARHDAWSWSS